MNEYLEFMKKAKLKAFLSLFISMIMASGFLYMAAVYDVYSWFKLVGFLGGLVFCLVFIKSVCLVIESIDGRNFFPKYQIGEVVIAVFFNRDGVPDKSFSRYDEIIEGLDKYTIKEIGECSYLLSSNSSDGKPKEVRFKERARCC